MHDCLFCSIVAGTIPADTVHEDELTVAFRDVSPQAPVHVLVVPREHLPDAAALAAAPGTVAALLRTATSVADSAGVGASGYRLVVNTGTDAHQSVQHVHVHVLGGRDLAWPPG